MNIVTLFSLQVGPTVDRGKQSVCWLDLFYSAFLLHSSLRFLLLSSDQVPVAILLGFSCNPSIRLLYTKHIQLEKKTEVAQSVRHGSKKRQGHRRLMYVIRLGSNGARRARYRRIPQSRVGKISCKQIKRLFLIFIFTSDKIDVAAHIGITTLERFFNLSFLFYLSYNKYMEINILHSLYDCAMWQSLSDIFMSNENQSQNLTGNNTY